MFQASSAPSHERNRMALCWEQTENLTFDTQIVIQSLKSLCMKWKAFISNGLFILIWKKYGMIRSSDHRRKQSKCCAVSENESSKEHFSFHNATHRNINGSHFLKKKWCYLKGNYHMILVIIFKLRCHTFSGSSLLNVMIFCFLSVIYDKRHQKVQTGRTQPPIQTWINNKILPVFFPLIWKDGIWRVLIHFNFNVLTLCLSVFCVVLNPISSVCANMPKIKPSDFSGLLA